MDESRTEISLVEVWATIDAQRGRIADLLETLSPRQWASPSLCDAWTVREVAAHLTLQELTPRQAVSSGLRHGGSLNRAINRSAVVAARELDETQIIARIRAMAGRHRHNAFVTERETLIDALVHGLDIAVPLGIGLPVPGRAAAASIERVVSYHGGRLSKVFRPLPWQGLRLRADDLDWSLGEGPEITGRVSDLLLLVTGRSNALERLRGAGAERIRAERTGS